MGSYTDAERLIWLVEDIGISGIGSVDLYERAAEFAELAGKDEPDNDDLLSAVRCAIDKQLEQA